MDAKFLPDAGKRDATASPSSSRPGRRERDWPRACRLVRAADFDALYRAGRRRSSRQFVVFFRPNGLGVARFGSSVKKALGNAVRRNRIRRRIREILRLHRQEIAPGWDIVIHPRSSVATAPFGPLAAELLALLRGSVGAAPTPRAPA